MLFEPHAKLWSLVNDPGNEAVCWDSSGQIIIINQQLLESQVLASGAAPYAGAFKTTNFSSFVRQLNLYGFRKVDPMSHVKQQESAFCHYFYSANFQQNRPDLVASLRRFTVGNKAKLHAGVEVKTRLPSRPGVRGGGQHVTKESLSLLRSAQQLLTFSHNSSPSPPPKQYSGTPMPPKCMKRVYSAGLSSPADAAGTLNPSCTGVPSPGKLLHHHQGLLTPANHAGNGLYQPGYYRPVCRCCHPVTSPQILGLQTGLYSPKNYYQAGFPVKKANTKGLEEKENQDAKICDVNLDKVFQIADEVMQSFPSPRLAPVKTPVVVLAPSSTTTAALAANASSSSVFKQEEASPPSRLQQTPKSEEVFQALAGPAPEEETINVEVCNS
ncbi:heat shock factor protein 5 isoform X2 [Oryzias latipes]